MSFLLMVSVIGLTVLIVRGGVKKQDETAATWISSIRYWKQQFCLLFSGFIHMEMIKFASNSENVTCLNYKRIK